MHFRTIIEITIILQGENSWRRISIQLNSVKINMTAENIKKESCIWLQQ